MTAPPKPTNEPYALRLVGRARVGDVTVTRAAIPCDNVMQAFLYRHLAPSRELAVAVRKIEWVPPPLVLADNRPVRITAGGTAEIQFKTVRPERIKQIELQLHDPPPGITLGDVTVGTDGFALLLKLDPGTATAGLADNLIVEGYRDVPIENPQGQAAKKDAPQNAKQDAKKDAPPQTRRIFVGILPAIPFVVVPQ